MVPISASDYLDNRVSVLVAEWLQWYLRGMDRAENKGLLVSSAGALVVGCVGVVFSNVTGSQAILLDGAFNLVYFMVSLMTLKVARLVYRGDDVRFPAGYSFFEPLINGVKGVLILGISSMALFDAVSALFSGGRNISPGLATVYGVFAASACWAVALVLRMQAKKSTSPLLKADAESWIVNAAISSAVLITFIIITIVNQTAYKSVVPYIDPLLVILVGGVTIGVPVKLAKDSLMGLINRAPPKAVVDKVEQVIVQALAGLKVENIAVRVLKPGRVRMVWVHVVLAEEVDIRVEELDAYRNKVFAELEKSDPLTIVDIIFTKDPAWGAPLGETTDVPSAV